MKRRIVVEAVGLSAARPQAWEKTVVPWSFGSFLVHLEIFPCQARRPPYAAHVECQQWSYLLVFVLS